MLLLQLLHPRIRNLSDFLHLHKPILGLLLRTPHCIPQILHPTLRLTQLYCQLSVPLGCVSVLLKQRVVPALQFLEHQLIVLVAALGLAVGAHCRVSGIRELSLQFCVAVGHDGQLRLDLVLLLQEISVGLLKSQTFSLYCSQPRGKLLSLSLQLGH